MEHRLLLALLVLLSCSFSNNLLAQQPSGMSVDTLWVGPGPEDLVLDESTGSARLLVSCSQRRGDSAYYGEIMAVDLATNDTLALPRTGEPKHLHFGPHGIDLVYNNKGIPYLYVVNHTKNEDKALNYNSILVYQVKADQLVFQKEVRHEDIVSPNDVAALPDGSFYLANDSKYRSIGFMWANEKLFKVRSSKITYCDPQGHCKFVGDERLAYANGIIADNDRVVVACTQKKDLVVYDRNSSNGDLTAVSNSASIVGQDNITQVNDSLILIAAHPKVFQFIKHAKDPAAISAGKTYLVNLNNGHSSIVYETDGSEISGNSTSLYYNGKLYIGQVFQGFLLVVDLPSPITDMAP